MIFTKSLKKEEERRTKQSLDSPQTIEANKKIKILAKHIDEKYLFAFSLHSELNHIHIEDIRFAD